MCCFAGGSLSKLTQLGELVAEWSIRSRFPGAIPWNTPKKSGFPPCSKLTIKFLGWILVKYSWEPPRREVSRQSCVSATGNHEPNDSKTHVCASWGKWNCTCHNWNPVAWYCWWKTSQTTTWDDSGIYITSWIVWDKLLAGCQPLTVWIILNPSSSVTGLLPNWLASTLRRFVFVWNSKCKYIDCLGWHFVKLSPSLCFCWRKMKLDGVLQNKAPFGNFKFYM